ncbi:PAS domain S-box protein [Ancylothrix sp. C2]|uniref:PAS domain S-box protein n=1 Tax=Ancylothrix sp. D3o TaxID=2953691 RepID=UPI0021BB4CDE|nr:PAS domain S-box protein [Ancylothrix sp. D3o]MCT7949565.1 PAS domain S-box protein [Ancylothrix sp. D3o]
MASTPPQHRQCLVKANFYHPATGRQQKRQTTFMLVKFMDQAAIIITAAQGSELSQLSKILSEYQILHAAVVDGSGKPVGLVTQNSLLQALNTSCQQLLSNSENWPQTKNSPLTSKTTNPSQSESSQFRLLLEKRFVDIILSDSETALIATLTDKAQLHPTANVAIFKNSQDAIFSGGPADSLEEKLLLQASLERTVNAIIIADKTGRIIHCNQLASQIYNKPREELINQPLREIIKGFNSQLLGELEQSLQTKDFWQTEITIERADGTRLFAHLTHSVIKNAAGEITGIIHTCTDISQKKELEQALQESQNQQSQPSPQKSNFLALIGVSLFNNLSSFTPTFKTIMAFNNPPVKPVFEQPGLGQYQNFWQANPAATKISWLDLKISPDSAFIEDSHKSASVESLTLADNHNPDEEDHSALSTPDQTQQQLQQLMEATATILYKAEFSGNFIIKNLSENSATILGYEAEEIIKNPSLWVSRIHPEDRCKIEKEILSHSQHKRTIEYRFLCKNGNYCWLRDEAHLIFDSAGTPAEIRGTCQDISQEKMLEEKVQEASEKEKELSELRRQFITITSHEFRTPLCTILSSADLLELYIERGRTEKQKEHIDRIQASAIRISNLLNDILATGKGIAGQIKCNPTLINLEDFCHQIINKISVTLSIDKERINFIKTGNCDNVFLDETLLERILVNLLSNAVKYSPVDTDILFELSCSQPAEQTADQQALAVFKIQDFGIGIPSNDIPHIFDAFYRGSNLNNQGGTGLGLTIVKQAADAHNAEIILESVVDAGTTFTVSLPI